MRLTLALLILLGYSASAQELPDLLGQWDYVLKGMEPHPQCGEATIVGELVIERKITARAYRGRARGEQTWEKCPGVTVTESAATIRIKDGNLVTIDYDEEGWTMDRLRVDGGKMDGDHGDGVTSQWVRADEVGGTDLTEEQIAELGEFLVEVEPELEAELSKMFRERLEKSLYKSGLSEEESSQVAGLTMTRMTSCMVEAIRESVLRFEMPIEQVLAGQNMALLFNPKNPDPLVAECVEDAEWNAGVRIR
jgi:hypothetical protein